MRERSLDSVRVFFADKPRVIRELRDWAARLMRERADVEKVGLFGSHATGTYGPRSAADLDSFRQDGSPWITHILKEVVWL